MQKSQFSHNEAHILSKQGYTKVSMGSIGCRLIRAKTVFLMKLLIVFTVCNVLSNLMKGVAYEHQKCRVCLDVCKERQCFFMDLQKFQENASVNHHIQSAKLSFKIHVI